MHLCVDYGLSIKKNMYPSKKVIVEHNYRLKLETVNTQILEQKRCIDDFDRTDMLQLYY